MPIPIHFTDPHRRKHFDFFRQMQQPHFNLTAHEDFTSFILYLKENHLPFTPAVVWALSAAAHEVREFRWRLRGEDVVEYELLRPSFTVRTEASDVFSFCTVAFDHDSHAFFEATRAQIQAMQENPSMEDEEGADDYLFMSAIPWVSFTSLQHAMPGNRPDSVPRIAWGKYYERDGRWWLPVSVQAHHALVDGMHMGRYFEQMQSIFQSPADFF